MIPKIFPRNLTARAAVEVTGNPVSTRMESGVGNCFPGLEFDHRNLDRRFFPGLVFEFTDRGAHLLSVDLHDPALDPKLEPGKTLAGATGADLGQGEWFIEEITQGDKTIRMSQDERPLDTTSSWRMVRCLEPGPVKIRLKRRREADGRPSEKTVDLKGDRRVYTDPRTGTISAVYAAGELTQSLCSPWMHDFRDCACFYWASNHPDIVLADSPPGEPTLPTGAPDDPVRALTPIDWLRSERSSAAPAKNSEAGNRPAQMDHYEINLRWQDLAVVLQGREISGVYHPQELETANPLGKPDDLAAKLTELATLEHAVALEYLYARYSLKHPDDIPNSEQALKDDLTFVRHEILVVAVSEMRHLRWANQLIWSLEHDGMLRKKFGPSLGIAARIPVADDKTRSPQLPASPSRGKTRPRQLRPLEPNVLGDFISVEQPSGFLDGQYAKVLSTLREKKYRPTLEQLAARIIGDGMEHYSRFRQIQVVLRKHAKPTDYLRPMRPAPSGDAEGQAAVQTYQQILADLHNAYLSGDMENAATIADARVLMFKLDEIAEKMARRGLGVAFFK